jgi:hypothetical protein
VSLEVLCEDERAVEKTPLFFAASLLLAHEDSPRQQIVISVDAVALLEDGVVESVLLDANPGEDLLEGEGRVILMQKMISEKGLELAHVLLLEILAAEEKIDYSSL